MPAKGPRQDSALPSALIEILSGATRAEAFRAARLPGHHWEDRGTREIGGRGILAGRDLDLTLNPAMMARGPSIEHNPADCLGKAAPGRKARSKRRREINGEMPPDG
jgi:hypothetical protein